MEAEVVRLDRRVVAPHAGQRCSPDHVIAGRQPATTAGVGSGDPGDAPGGAAA
ncbi:MAG: hypothetical protein R2713_21455 [Ilumatobacteraceae bacterium]